MSSLRRSMNAPFGGGGGTPPPPPATPDPVWELDGDDAVFSGGLLVSWPSVVGPSMTPVVGAEPSDGGPLANGHQGVLFPTAGARCDSSGVISASPVSECSFMVAIDPDNAEASVEFETIAQIWNNTPTTSSHFILAHQSGQASFNDFMGAFASNGWRTTSVIPRSRKFILTVALSSDGTIRFYRNLTLVATVTGTPASFALSYFVIGATYGSLPLIHWLKGCIYRLKMWNVYLPPADQAVAAGAMMTTYGVVDSLWQPTDTSGLTLQVDAAAKQGIGATTFDGSATLALWGNRAGAVNNLTQGTAGQYPSDPGVAARCNGRPVVRFDGTDDWMAGQVISTYFTASAYEYDIVFKLRSLPTQTGTIPYLLQQLICDQSEFFWTGLRNNSGACDMHIGHWDGAAKSVVIPSVSIGDWHHLHVWYDGTNIRATLDGVAATPVAAGNVTNNSSPLYFMRSGNTLYTPADSPEMSLWNLTLSAGNRANMSSYVLDKYGLS